MKFEYASAGPYSDVASGAVLHSAPGFPAFPVRLALELFDRARALTGRDQTGLWDPACGAGGMVTTLALLRRDHLRTVRAGDTDPDAVALAHRNLALTSAAGLRSRIEELHDLGASPERLDAAARLLNLVTEAQPLQAHIEQADATRALAAAPDIDIVVTDLPYGSQTNWASATDDPATAMLQQLQTALPSHAAVVLVSADRHGLPSQTPAHRSFKHGRRYAKIYLNRSP